MNKFDQLVEDLVTGELTLIQVQIAIRTAVRRWETIPDPIKDLLSGSGDSNAGLIFRMFSPIMQVMGGMELAFRRGVQVGFDSRPAGK